jgi:hypothetical protein
MRLNVRARESSRRRARHLGRSRLPSGGRSGLAASGGWCGHRCRGWLRKLNGDTVGLAGRGVQIKSGRLKVTVALLSNVAVNSVEERAAQGREIGRVWLNARTVSLLLSLLKFLCVPNGGDQAGWWCGESETGKGNNGQEES